MLLFRDDARVAERTGLTTRPRPLGMTALAGLVNDGRLTPTVAATSSLAPAGAAQSARTGAGKTVLTLV